MVIGEIPKISFKMILQLTNRKLSMNEENKEIKLIEYYIGEVPIEQISRIYYFKQWKQHEKL